MLGKALGHKYVQLASETLMAISINIFVRRKLRDHFSDVRTSSVATGQARLMALLHLTAPCCSRDSSQRIFEQLACYAGIGNVLGNKGAVAVAATYLQKVSLLFINSHFAAHQDKVLQRQADFLRIRSGLFAAKDAQGAVAAEMKFCLQLQGIDRCSCDLQKKMHGPPSVPGMQVLMAAPRPFPMGQSSLQQQPFWSENIQRPSVAMFAGCCGKPALPAA